MAIREVIFRGKRTDNGEWIEGFYSAEEYNPYIEKIEYIPRIQIIGKCVSLGVIPETVGQYTGLTDKNGKRIFEGDIFKFDDEVWESSYTSCGTEYDSFAVENYGVVGFDEDMARFDFIKYKFHENSVEADLHENHTIDFSEFVCELEVIGNIHDNPELLKGDTE